MITGASVSCGSLTQTLDTVYIKILNSIYICSINTKDSEDNEVGEQAMHNPRKAALRAQCRGHSINSETLDCAEESVHSS